MSKILPRGVPFTQIGNQFILDTRVSHVAKCVYMYLMYRANKEARTWPSMRTISIDMKMSPSTVSKALIQLEELGWVQTERSSRKPGDSHLPPNCYVVNGTLVPANEQAPELVPGNGQASTSKRTPLVPGNGTEQQTLITTPNEQQEATVVAACKQQWQIDNHSIAICDCCGTRRTPPGR